MIKITMLDKKWRITIGDEVWQFDDYKTMFTTLDNILRIKDKFGRIK